MKIKVFRLKKGIRLLEGYVLKNELIINTHPLITIRKRGGFIEERKYDLISSVYLVEKKVDQQDNQNPKYEEYMNKLKLKGLLNE